MSYILVSSGINSKHDAMNSTGLTSTSGTTDGLKPALAHAGDGSYQKLFEASVLHLKDTSQLDTSLLHGDGTNTVVKKGDLESVTQDINTRKETKNSL